MNLENMENYARKRRIFNGCAQLSVNVESTNRADFRGSRRKNTVNVARYLRDGWKTNRPATMVEHRAGLSMNERELRYAC